MGSCTTTRPLQGPRGDVTRGCASPLCSKVALADSVEDPPEASPLCSKVALADSVGDPLEASPLCSKVALTDSIEDPLEASPIFSKRSVNGDKGEQLKKTTYCQSSLKNSCKEHLEHYSAMTKM